MSSIDKKSKAEAPSLLTLVMALGLGSLLLLYRGRLVLGFALFGVLVLAMGTIGQPDNRNVRILGEDGVVAAGAKSYTLSVLADESVDPSKVIFRRVDGDRTSVLPGTPVRNKAGTRILFKVKQSLKDVGLHTFEAELVKRVDVRTNSAKQKNIPVTREVSVSKTQMNVLACANTKVVVTDVEYALTKSWGRNFAVRPARQNVAQDGARAGLEALGKARVWGINSAARSRMWNWLWPVCTAARMHLRPTRCTVTSWGPSTMKPVNCWRWTTGPRW